MTEFSRRGVIGGSAALAGGLAMLVGQASAQTASEPPAAPQTGAPASAPFPSFRFPLGSITAQKQYPGGWGKEVNAQNFPPSESFAGVLMELKPGGLRELHWHANAAEWAYVIDGACRITVIDPGGGSETLDLAAGDVWFFPRGHGHSIEGLGPSGTTFVLVFDNGAFSEFATFSITDWLAHTPVKVLAKNLGVPVSTFAAFPKEEAYISLGAPPGAAPWPPAPGSLDTPPLTHGYHLLGQQPRRYPGGTVRLVSEKEFPISASMTGALITLEPGALREMHWHPNADEWQLYLAGTGQMTVFGSAGRASTDRFGEFDVGYVPRGCGHYIENVGDDEPAGAARAEQRHLRGDLTDAVAGVQPEAAARQQLLGVGGDVPEHPRGRGVHNGVTRGPRAQGRPLPTASSRQPQLQCVERLLGPLPDRSRGRAIRGGHDRAASEPPECCLCRPR